MYATFMIHSMCINLSECVFFLNDKNKQLWNYILYATTPQMKLQVSFMKFFLLFDKLKNFGMSCL